MSIVLQSSGGGQITLQEPTTASNFTQTLPAATGTVVISGTTPTLNGITFPATQVPSADANTLDDYEEGTWTPVMGATSASPTVTYATRVGRYVKIGKYVYALGRITLSAKSGGSGQVQIEGLPFTPPVSSVGGTLIVGYMDGWVTNGPTAGYVRNGTTEAILHYFNGGTSPGNLTTANVGSTTDISFSIVYEAA